MSREECSPAIVLPRTNILDVEGGELARLTPRCARRGERKQRAPASPAMRSTAARRVDVPFGAPAACVGLLLSLCTPQHSKHTSIIMNNYVYCSSLGMAWERLWYVSIGPCKSHAQSRRTWPIEVSTSLSSHQNQQVALEFYTSGYPSSNKTILENPRSLFRNIEII